MGTPCKVFVTRRIPEAGLRMLQARADVTVWPGTMPPSRDELRHGVQGAAGILSLLSDTIDGSVMDAAGNGLKGIANFAVGYNNIDVAAAQKRGLQVGNTPDVLTDATADVAVALLLAAARRFQEAIDNVRNREWKTWEPLGFIGQDLHRKTIGIIGMGRIGQAVARRMHGGWRMNVLYTARSPKPSIDQELQATHVPLERLLAEADFVSIHTDLNATTQHLLGASEFRAMKPSAVLINTARGGVIDQLALYEALKSGTIFAAGLDVTDPEPLPDDHPLRTLPSCLILPHIASATRQARDRMATMAAENLLAALADQPMPYAVTRA